MPRVTLLVLLPGLLLPLVTAWPWPQPPAPRPRTLTESAAAAAADIFVFPNRNEPHRGHHGPSASSGVGTRVNRRPAPVPPSTPAPGDVCTRARNQTVWYPPSGMCETLLAYDGGPCGNGEWLVLNAADLAVCKARDCGTEKKVLVHGRCEEVGDPAPCPEGMHVVVQVDGSGDCDCKEGHVWRAAEQQATPARTARARRRRDPTTPQPHTPQGRCYPAFERGPCLATQVLRLSPSGEVACLPSLCPPSSRKVKVQVSPAGQVSLPTRGLLGTCMELNKPCAPHTNPDWMLHVNGKTLQLECGKFEGLRTRQLIDAPPFGCAQGSKRDATGRCRKSIS